MCLGVKTLGCRRFGYRWDAIARWGVIIVSGSSSERFKDDIDVERDVIVRFFGGDLLAKSC